MRTLNTQQDVNKLMNINNYSHIVTSLSWEEVNRRTHAEQEHQPTRSKIQSLFRQKSVYNAAMEEQRTRSQENSKFTAGDGSDAVWHSVRDASGATSFQGYEFEETSGHLKTALVGGADKGSQDVFGLGLCMAMQIQTSVNRDLAPPQSGFRPPVKLG